MFENYINSSFNDCHNVYTEQINNIALSSNDDTRLQTFDKITTYPYGMEQNEKASFEETININDQF